MSSARHPSAFRPALCMQEVPTLNPLHPNVLLAPHRAACRYHGGWTQLAARGCRSHAAGQHFPQAKPRESPCWSMTSLCRTQSGAAREPRAPGRPARPAGVPRGFCCEKARGPITDGLVKSPSPVYRTDGHLLVWAWQNAEQNLRFWPNGTWVR